MSTTHPSAGARRVIHALVRGLGAATALAAAASIYSSLFVPMGKVGTDLNGHMTWTGVFYASYFGVAREAVLLGLVAVGALAVLAGCWIHAARDGGHVLVVAGTAVLLAVTLVSLFIVPDVELPAFCALLSAIAVYLPIR